MISRSRKLAIVALLFGAVPAIASSLDTTESTTTAASDISSAVKISHDYPFVYANITYNTVDNLDLKLDVYKPQISESHDRKTLRPTLIFMHGGGWGQVDREIFQLFFLPFLQLDWVVVSVEYRPSSVSLAPAAVEDCRCAMKWVIRHSGDYDIDTKQLVLMGNSAGGELALAVGFGYPSNSGLIGKCVSEMTPNQRSSDSIKAAAIINWFGISDVTDVIAGQNQRDWAVTWIGNQADRMAVSREVSPLTYVRPGVPPVITIHGDQDKDVPYSQSVRLHAALAKAGVMNKLITIGGGGHGLFSLKSTADAYSQIFQFLQQAGVHTSEQ